MEKPSIQPYLIVCIGGCQQDPFWHVCKRCPIRCWSVEPYVLLYPMSIAKVTRDFLCRKLKLFLPVCEDIHPILSPLPNPSSNPHLQPHNIIWMLPKIYVNLWFNVQVGELGRVSSQIKRLVDSVLSWVPSAFAVEYVMIVWGKHLI